MEGHLDNDALLRALYGVGGAGETGHAASCGRCAAALSALESRRLSGTVPAALDELPEAFWQRQRRAIAAQLNRPTLPPLRWAAAAASALAVFAALVLAGGKPQPPVASAAFYTAEDEQLLREINLVLRHVEPRALAPANLLLPNEFKEVQRP